MKKVIKLKESDLARMVKQIMKESKYDFDYEPQIMEPDTDRERQVDVPDRGRETRRNPFIIDVPEKREEDPLPDLHPQGGSFKESVKPRLKSESMYGSFGNMKRNDYKGDTYYGNDNRIAKDSEIYGVGNDDKYDTEEFETFKKLQDKYGDKQKWFGKNDGERMFNLYKEKTGKPFKVKTRKSEMGESMRKLRGESKDLESRINNYFKNKRK